MGGFWHATWEVARKEVLQHVRTKRLLIIGSLLALLLAVVTVILPLTLFNIDEADFGAGGDTPALENFAFLIYLNFSVLGGFFFIQLLCIVLTSDAVCSEWGNRTIFLLLSKPVPRAAFVLGKYLGSLATVVVTFSVLLTLDYAIVQGVFPGTPSAEDVGRFFGALGILIIGSMAFSAMALFFSTLSRSNVMSLILTLVVGLVVFPLIGNIGDFTYFADTAQGEAGDQSDFRYDWSHYFSPERAMITAGGVLVGEGNEIPGFTFLIPQFPPQILWLSIVSSLAFTAVFVSASLLVVQRRNFE